MSLLHRAHNFYARYERPLSSLSLIGGFIFDALTLKRVDLFWENFWVVVHLLVVSFCIIALQYREHQKKHNEKIHFWLVTVLQFAFGGLLSTFLIFYFRSAALAVAWPFILILVLAFIANERFKKHYSRMVFQIGILYLSIFSFSIFIVPVIVHNIGRKIFLTSGFAGLVLIFLFVLLLRYFAKEPFKKNKTIVVVCIASIFILMNALYFLNAIPPVPLSLKDDGAYHDIIKISPSEYQVTYEPISLIDRIFSIDDVHLIPGEPLYVYSSIFSPTKFNPTIVHEWQKYDDATKKWVTIGRVPLAVSGGLDNGYATYSMDPYPSTGNWRVNVETQNGEVIGRIRFDVLIGTNEPLLQTEIKT